MDTKQPDPNEQMFRITIKAEGEVRDAEGNLLSSTPVAGTMDVTATQLAEMGIDPADIETGQ